MLSNPPTLREVANVTHVFCFLTVLVILKGNFDRGRSDGAT